MRNALALAKRILQQFSHDPKTIVMFILAPILILWLFSAMLGNPDYKPHLAAVDLPEVVLAELDKQDATYVEVSADEAEALLENRQVDATLKIEDTVLLVKVEGADSSRTGSVMLVVQSTAQEVAATQREQILDDARAEADKMQATMEEKFDSIREALEGMSHALAAAQAAGAAQMQALPEGVSPPAGMTAPGPVELPDLDAVEMPDFESLMSDDKFSITDFEISYLHGSDDWNLFDFLGPVFIGIFIFVFVFITSGMSLVTERTGGTMERLLVTPIRSWQLVAGYSLGFGVVTLIQAGIILWACIFLIGFPNEGPIGLVLLTTFSMALVSLTLGLLVSALAKTPFQVIQLMILFVVPQILLSGIFDLTQAPTWMQVLNQCFPLSYGADALRDVMLRGADFGQIATNLAVLWGFIVAFFGLATLSFNLRRSR